MMSWKVNKCYVRSFWSKSASIFYFTYWICFTNTNHSVADGVRPACELVKLQAAFHFSS